MNIFTHFIILITFAKNGSRSSCGSRFCFMIFHFIAISGRALNLYALCDFPGIPDDGAEIARFIRRASYMLSATFQAFQTTVRRLPTLLASPMTCTCPLFFATGAGT